MVKIYHIDKNPLTWLDEILNNVEFANFFENRVTEYTRAATTGTWDDVFGDFAESSEEDIKEVA